MPVSPWPGWWCGDRVQLTNLPWLIDCRALEMRFGFQRVQLINDLTAVAASLAHLGPDDLPRSRRGQGLRREIRGIIAPGTGLGEGLLVEVEGKTFARGSEGGHCDFAPVDDEQTWPFLSGCEKKHRPVSYESLIAGPGLAHLYEFCKKLSWHSRDRGDCAAMARAEDRIPIIVDGAVGEDGCPLCRRAIELFLVHPRQ